MENNHKAYPKSLLYSHQCRAYHGIGGHFIADIYDETGSPIGMQYRTSSMSANEFETYYFEKNLQGDVIAIYNASGTKLVSYIYDAWGNCAKTTYYNGGSSTGAQYNPFRYRGYYFDTGLELYYLNNRYYDSRTGRFINPDDYTVIGATPMSLTDKNLYAYCDNNPVTREDGDGDFWGTIFGAVMGAISGGINAYQEGDNVLAGIGIGLSTGALSGLFVDLSVATGGVAGLIIAGAGGAISSFLDDAANNIVNDKEWNGGQIATDAIVSGGMNMLSFGMGLEPGVHTGAKTLKQAFKNAAKNFKMAFANSAGRISKYRKYRLRNLAKNIGTDSFGTVIDQFANDAISGSLDRWFGW